MSLKQKLIAAEGNRAVKVCNNAVRKIHTSVNAISLIPGQIYRSMGGTDKRYIALRDMKDKYKGERCFILATGPSLRNGFFEKKSLYK